jgi:hypothetical protein
MVDLKRYYRLNTHGLCRVEKNNDRIVVFFARYDHETGDRMKDEENNTSVDELTKVKADLEQQLNAINAILWEVIK